MRDLEPPFVLSQPHTLKTNMNGPEAPFLEATRTVRQGLVVPYGVYGSDDTMTQAPSPDDDFDLATIEEYAPTAARLIKGLSPEESIALLESRIENIRPYQDLPVVGVFVKNKIKEYELRLDALKRQANIERIKRLLTLATWGIGLTGVAGFSLWMWNKYNQTKEQ